MGELPNKQIQKYLLFFKMKKEVKNTTSSSIYSEFTCVMIPDTVINFPIDEALTSRRFLGCCELTTKT